MFPDTFVTDVLLKVMAGNFSALKKSSVFRWPSLLSLPVLTEATSALKSKTASEKSSLEEVILASNFPKLPSTSEIFRWTMEKPTLACDLSRTQSWANVTEETRTAAKNKTIFFMLDFLKI
ncbi:hypothetical protein D9M68_949930 [compost metagenome]